MNWPWTKIDKAVVDLNGKVNGIFAETKTWAESLHQQIEEVKTVVEDLRPKDKPVAQPPNAGTGVKCGFCGEGFLCYTEGCMGAQETTHYHCCDLCMGVPQIRQIFARLESVEDQVKELVSRLI